MKDSSLTSLHSVGVRRNNRWLVRDIDLDIHRREIVSLIGPNGSGKTTVTKILAGSLSPDTGTLKRADNIKVGYVPQRISLDSTLPITVRRLMDVPQRVDRTEMQQVFEEFNIKHLADSPVQELSGGEFQRSMLARAILRKPDLLILDEPNEGLDFRGEAQLYGHIVDIRNRLNCGILLVCHDLHVVMKQTDTVVCINVHVCCTGTPEHVQNNEAYLNLFGHKTFESRAIYTHSHDHSHHLDGSVTRNQ